jgi:N-acetylglucosaminyldiphosphoundecaprenol N-acetyl-beta-D-mannosaminyltransferase
MLPLSPLNQRKANNDIMKEKIDIANVMINNVSMVEALTIIEDMIENMSAASIVTPNVDHIVKLQKDEEFRSAYHDAALVLADGVPLLWAARFLGTPLKEKISGSDLFPKVCGVAAEKGYRLFFCGGREGAADTAKAVLETKYPGLKVVGTYCPPFGFEADEKENSKIIQLIKDVKPDILFVGLGAPKQEKWINKYEKQYQVPVSIGIGVSFEFVAGMVKRAPLWMQKIGLEWFWRIMMEPGRLWRRYLVDDMEFFGLVLKQKYNVLH